MDFISAAICMTNAQSTGCGNEPAGHLVDIQRNGKIPERLLCVQFHLRPGGFAKKAILTGRLAGPACQLFLRFKFGAETRGFEHGRRARNARLFGDKIKIDERSSRQAPVGEPAQDWSLVGDQRQLLRLKDFVDAQKLGEKMQSQPRRLSHVLPQTVQPDSGNEVFRGEFQVFVEK